MKISENFRLKITFGLCFTVLFCATSIHISGQNLTHLPSEKPKLVIGIIIDQMRYDYIFKFWDKYENNGFKRLVNEGSFCKNANYNYLFTQSNCGFATISTGANPSAHGIISDRWYAQLSDKIIHCTMDDEAQCIGGDPENDCGKHSPSKLLASTFGDELKLSTFKMSKVIAVSIDPSASVILAGHIADAAYWLDPYTGNFVTSSVYRKEIPAWVKDFNGKKFGDIYLSESWTKLLADSMYFECLPDNNRYEDGIKGIKMFPYDLKSLSLKSDGRLDYSILKYAPQGNNLVKDFAVSAIVNESMGKGKYTDYICIDFSATEYISQTFGLTSIEMEDSYLRLDKEIQHLLDFLDSYIGKGNMLVYLTSNHGAVYNPKYMTDLGVPSGYFNQGQSIALLKSYLNIVYGKGDWIKLYNNQQLFLNRLLIQDSKLSLTAFQDDVAQFLLQFTGVTNVVTSSMLQKTNYSEGIFEKMQNSFHQKRSGDIIINLEPGWTEYNDASTAHNSAYTYDSHVPLIFYGWKINRQVIYDPVDIIDIAPTLSMFLDIPYPNASQGKPIVQLLK
jgi:predicted AlkP superfamily pyrophosphatase or phosphodiesterase